MVNSVVRPLYFPSRAISRRSVRDSKKRLQPRSNSSCAAFRQASGGTGSEPIEVLWSTQKTHDLARIDGDHAGNPPSGSNPELVQAIVRAHARLRLLVDGTHESIESLAHAVDLHPKVVRSRIRLAFLEPATTQEFLRNNQPTFRNLNELAASIELGWSENRVRISH